MDAKQFWIAVWRTVGATLLSLALVIAGCDAYNTQSIAGMVEKGVNPLDAKCAIKGDDNKGCVLRYSR